MSDIKITPASGVPLSDTEKARFIAALFDRNLIDEEQADRFPVDWRKYSQTLKPQALP